MFKINGVSYDEYIVEKRYTMNRTPEYGGTEYRDGWWKRHRSIVRYSINGSVTLAFPTAELYNAFVDAMQNGIGTEGDYTVEAYVNTTNMIHTFTAYLTPTTKTAIATKAYDRQAVYFNVTLKVEER